MEIIYKKVQDLIPYINNSRTHSEEQVNQIVASINEFGFTNPLLIDEKDNIIAGHGRLMASKKLGMEEVPCIVLKGLTEAQKKAYIIADNKMALNAGWDEELLKIELENLKELDFDLDLTGFNVDELDDIFQAEEEQEVIEDDFDIEPPEEPKAKLGDIYQLGNHRLMCGSALIKEDVEKLLDNNKCELTFTDPPYQLDTQGGGILKSANSMKQIKENGVDSFEPSKLILFSDTNIYCHNKPLIKKYIELAEENNKPYDLCFYKKTNTVPNYKGHMMTDCEYIAIIGNQDPNKGLEKEEYSKCYIGQKDNDNELSYSKPVGLCAKYIKLYGKENILDLFGGSGSTLIACEQLNRKCYMMELDPKYVDVIIQRWENFTGKKAVLLNKGE